MHASIAKSPLDSYQTASGMNELTQERSRMHASIAKSPLDSYQTASDMNELTQERSRIYMQALSKVVQQLLRLQAT